MSIEVAFHYLKGDIIMIEVEKNEKVVFKGSKSESITFLKENRVKLEDDDPLLLIANIAKLHGFSMYIR